MVINGQVSLDFLDENGFEVMANLDDLEELALNTAVSRITKETIADFFRSNIKRHKN